MQLTIEEAIRQKRLVCIRVNGKLGVYEPYLLGISENSQMRLYAYQVDNESFSGEEGWRVFNISYIEKVISLNKTFVPSRKYSAYLKEVVRVVDVSEV